MFCIYYFSFIKRFMVKHIFYVSNFHYLINNQIHVLYCWSFKKTNLVVLFCPCSIYSISIINRLLGKHVFDMSHCHCLIENQIHVSYYLSIDQTNLSISFCPVMVKRQAEEVGKRAQDKLRAQGNYKHKTRARLKKRARK